MINDKKTKLATFFRNVVIFTTITSVSLFVCLQVVVSFVVNDARSLQRIKSPENVQEISGVFNSSIRNLFDGIELNGDDILSKNDIEDVIDKTYTTRVDDENKEFICSEDDENVALVREHSKNIFGRVDGDVEMAQVKDEIESIYCGSLMGIDRSKDMLNAHNYALQAESVRNYALALMVFCVGLAIFIRFYSNRRKRLTF